MNRPTHRNDIAMYFNICSDKFGELAAILELLERSMEDDDSTVKKAVSACYAIASDYEDQAEGFQQMVLENGVRND